RQAHRRQRAPQVAVQLPEVGDARVGRELRLRVHVALQRPLRRAVAAELDLGIGDHAVVPSDTWIDPARSLTEFEPRAEVVTSEGEGPQAACCREVVRIEPERLVEDSLRLWIEAGVAALPDLLEIGEPELGVALGIGGRLAHLRLEALDPLSRGGARQLTFADGDLTVTSREVRLGTVDRPDRQKDG